MSQISRIIFVAMAGSLTIGAAQLASGRDLAQGTIGTIGASEATINRTAKADRVTVAAESAVQTHTISVRLDGLSDTSVLIRVPVVKEAPNALAAPTAVTKFPTSVRRQAVACEPVVSVLTEVAKLLQPGRCVT